MRDPRYLRDRGLLRSLNSIVSPLPLLVLNHVARIELALCITHMLEILAWNLGMEFGTEYNYKYL